MSTPRLSVVAALRTEVRGLLAGTRRVLDGHDLGASAATLTFFSGIAIVPWLLLTVWTTTWWWGADEAEDRLLALRVLVPDAMGGRTPYDELVAAGAHLGLVGALVVLFPASFYGDGLRRAALSVTGEEERFTSWKGRAYVLVPVVTLPLLSWVFFTVGEQLAPLTPEGGDGSATALVVRVVVGFHVVWLLMAVPLAWTLRFVVPGRPRWWVAVIGGLSTSAFLVGFLYGFQSFLAIPVDVGIPFGGLGVVGGMVAVGLWLYLLHVVVLLGWATTTALEQRAERGTPLADAGAPA